MVATASEPGADLALTIVPSPDPARVEQLHRSAQTMASLIAELNRRLGYAPKQAAE